MTDKNLLKRIQIDPMVKMGKPHSRHTSDCGIYFKLDDTWCNEPRNHL